MENITTERIVMWAILCSIYCGYVVGQPTKTKFSLSPGKNATPSIPELLKLAANNVHDCATKCHKKRLCIALTFNPNIPPPQCTLLKSADINPVKTDVSVHYGVALSRPTVNACPSSPCQNDATCFDEIDTYSCLCSPGFTGTVCADIDHCLNNTCENGATCVNGLLEYTCSCAAGYTGNMCQIDEATHILIFSGYNSSGAQADIIDFVPGTKTFTILNTTTQYGTYHRQVAIWEGKVIVDGGWQYASFEVFDTQPLVKLTHPVTPKLRSYGCAGAVNAKFYSCFGIDAANNGRSCDVYDLDNNYARTTLQMQVSFDLSRMACVFTDDYLYTIGGHNTAPTNTFYRFSLNNGTVTALPNYYQNRVYSRAVMYQGNIVNIGGSTGVVDTNECRLYNLTSAQWQSFASLNAVVNSQTCVNWGSDKIVCMGGHPGLANDKVELYENGEWIQYANMSYGMAGPAAVILDRNV